MSLTNYFRFNDTRNNCIIQSNLYDDHIICKIIFNESGDTYQTKIINSDIKIGSVNKFFAMMKNAFESKPEYSYIFTFMEDNHTNIFITFTYSNELIELKETITWTKQIYGEIEQLEQKILCLETQLESQKVFYENKINELEKNIKF